MSSPDSHAELELRNRQLHQVGAIGRLLLASIDSDDVLRGVAQGICEFGRLSRCLILEYDGTTDMLRGRAGHGLDPADVDAVRAHIDEAPPIRQAVERQSIVVIPDPYDGPLLPLEYLQQFDVAGSLVVVPLRSAEMGVLGIAILDRGGEDFELSVTQHRALSTFADLAALAMQNAALVERSRQLAAVLERSQVAANLHDSLSQALFAARMKITELLDDDLPASARRLAEEAGELTAEAVDRIHEALYTLVDDGRGAGTILDDIRDVVNEFVDEDFASIDLVLRGQGADPSGAPAKLLVRAVREGLTNVYKYARATEVVVTVRRGVVWWSVEISDDGCGDPVVIRRHLTASHAAFGLASLDAESRRLGGRLYVGRDARLGGIALSISVPASEDPES